MYILDKAWSEDSEILKEVRVIVFAMATTVTSIFYFIKCFLLVFGIILTNFKKNYQAKITVKVIICDKNIFRLIEIFKNRKNNSKS